MKIRKPFYSILLSFLLLASCGTEETPETTVPDLPRESESDTAAGDVSAEEPENTETPGIIDTETEPEEITIVLGEETEPEEKKNRVKRFSYFHIRLRSVHIRVSARLTTEIV